MSQFIYVGKPEISDAVQKILFDKGYYWLSGGKTVQFTHAEALTLEEGSIKYLSKFNAEWLNKNDYKEISLREVCALPNVETVQVGGYVAAVSANEVVACNVHFSYELIKEIVGRMKS